MSEESLESILEAARKLPIDEQLRLAEQLLKYRREQDEDVESRTIEAHKVLDQALKANSKKHIKAKATTNRELRALEAVEKTRGSMRGLDRDTIIWLAEDEELCGY